MDNGVLVMEEKKNIALIAHDNMKHELIQWVKKNEKILANHSLLGTGTTASLLTAKTDMDVFAYKSGPMGGDQQIGSRIAEGLIDIMIFFWDPLEAQPHDPDVKALLRIAVLYDIPVANNRATADFILSSPLINQKYERHIYDFERSLTLRNELYRK